MSYLDVHDRMPDLFEIAARIATGEVSPVALTERVLQAIEDLDPTLNAYITVMPERALQQARQAEEEIASGTYRGPLHGVPMSVKDLYSTRGTLTTCGSAVLRDFVPDFDATLVQRLQAHGAIIVAKANMLEFAYASVHPDYGPTKNPWDLTRTTSGSSGGSAAAVAAGIDFASFGTDTGGSIRIPASFCGVCGLKPTYGRVSRYGMQPLSWTLDHAGPFTRSARDIAVLLRAIGGYDSNDPFCADVAVPDYQLDLTTRLDGTRVAMVANFVDAAVPEEISNAVKHAASVLENAGATVVEVSIPELEAPALAAVMNILLPEASHSHRNWYPEQRENYTETVRERLEAGRSTPTVDYIAALEYRDNVRKRLREIQTDIDLLIMPTTPMVATPLESTTLEVKEGEEDLTALIRMTAPFDLTGQPALSIPCGFSDTGLPIGLQIVGRDFEEAVVLKTAHAYQTRTDWHRRKPPVSMVW